jgi:predicted acylesterase/phospholipase RssA
MDTRGRELALVLSGGGMNAMLLELGLLRRLRESALWPRLGWIYGTSAGALAGVMAALDRLDELDAFLMRLQPDETFRPNRLWQLPLTGLHQYELPRTIADRLGPPEELARELRASPVELVVCVTDVSAAEGAGERHAFELTFSSRSAPPELMAHAILASAAISALVLPLRVGEAIATDGGWVRNFPLGHAYDNPEVERIVGFRYVSRFPRSSADTLERIRRRLERFRAAPPVRALLAELELAEERQARGEPAHLPEMIARLMRVAVARNTELEERQAAERDASVHELESLRRDLTAIARRYAAPGRKRQAAAAVEARFAAARFPFRHDRVLPTIIVRGDPGELSLEPGSRPGLLWPESVKRKLIARGYELADTALRAHGVDAARRAS